MAAEQNYSTAWKIGGRMAQESKFMKLKGYTKKAIDVSPLTPTEWLEQKRATGEAFLCKKRSAILTRTACSKLRVGGINRYKGSVYDSVNEENAASVGICIGCTQYMEG